MDTQEYGKLVRFLKLITPSYIGGQLEIVRLGKGGYFFRGEVAEIIFNEENDTNGIGLLVTFRWLAKSIDGELHSETDLSYAASVSAVHLYDPNGRLFFTVTSRNEQGIFFPEGYYSNIKPSMVQGLK